MSKTSANDPFAGVGAGLDLDVDKWLRETEEKSRNNRGQGAGESEYISLDDFALRMQSEDAPHPTQNVPSNDMATSSFSRSWDGKDMVYKCSYCDYKNAEEYAMLCHCARLHVDEDFNNTMLNINKAAAKLDESISLGADVPPTLRSTHHDSDSEDDGMHIMNPRCNKSKSNDLSSKLTRADSGIASQNSVLNSASGRDRSDTSSRGVERSIQEQTMTGSSVSVSPAASNSGSTSLRHKAIRNAMGANTDSCDSSSTTREDIPICFDIQLPTPPALLPDDSSDGRSIGGDFDTPKNKNKAEESQSADSRTVQISASGGGENSARVSQPETSGRIPMAVALTPSWVSTPPSFLASKTISSQPYTTCAAKQVIPSPPPLISQAKSGPGFVANISPATTGVRERTQASPGGPGMLPNWPVQNQTSSASKILQQIVQVQSNQTSFPSQRQPPLGQPPFVVENPLQAHTRTSPATTAPNMQVRYTPPVAHQQQNQLPKANGQSFLNVQPTQAPSIPTHDSSTMTRFLQQQTLRTRTANSQHTQVASQNLMIQQQLRNQVPLPRGQAQGQQTPVTHQQQQVQRHLMPAQVAQNVLMHTQRPAQVSNQPLPQSAYQFHFHTNPNKQQTQTASSNQRPSILRRNQNSSNVQPRHPSPMSQPNLPTSQNNPRFQQMTQNRGPQSALGQVQATSLSNINMTSFNQAMLKAHTSTPQMQNQVLFQQALLQSKAAASTRQNTVASANLFAGGSVVMANQQATSSAQVRLAGQQQQQQLRNGARLSVNRLGQPQGPRLTVNQLTGVNELDPNRGLKISQITSPAATGGNVPPNFTTSQKVNPAPGSGDLQGQDGKLYMMKPIGQSFVLTPYGNEKMTSQIPAPTGAGSTARININLLQNIKDTVADPILLAYLDGKDVPKNVKFKCKLCSAQTESLNMIRWHLYAHHLQSAPRPFKCLKCTESFFSEKHAYDHARDRHHSEKCHAFDESITQIAQKHSATMFKVYAAIVTDQDEAKVQHARMFSECQICLQRMQDPKSMRLHMETMHNPFKSAAFQCWYCPECSDSEETIKEHVKKAHVNQPSQYTRDQPPGKKREKITNRLMDFSKPVPITPNVKSFSITENQPENAEESELISCPLCTFVSVQTVSLENHLKNDHLPFKPYLCHGNDFKAATIKMLKKHLAQKHIEWLQSGSLHKRVSIDGELSACQDRETTRLLQKALQKGLENAIDFCSAELIQFDNKCSECQYKASTHTMLETHIKLRHLMATPYICRLCGIATALRQSIRNHIGKKHPIENPDDIIFTDEAGEHLQEEETMKIVIRSICLNSDDQGDETALEPLPSESNKTKCDSDRTVDAVAVGADIGDRVTPGGDDQVKTTLQTTITPPVQPIINLAVSSAATSVQPVVTPALQPLANLPATPVVTPATLPLATQPPLQSPVLLLHVAVPQMSVAPSASQTAPVQPIIDTPSSGTRNTTSDEMISAAIGLARVKTEPGLEEPQPGQETKSGSESIRTRLSEFLGTRPARGQEQNAIEDNVTSAQSLPPGPSVLMVNHPTPPASVPVADAVHAFGVVPVAAAREIPNSHISRSAPSETVLDEVSQDEMRSQGEKSTSDTQECQKDKPVDRNDESGGDKQATESCTDLSQSVQSQAVQSQSVQSQSVQSQSVQSQSVQSQSVQSQSVQSQSVQSQSVQSQAGGERNSLVSVRTDKETNAVVISIPDRGSTMDVDVLDTLSIPLVAESTISNISSEKSVAGPAKNIQETVSKSKTLPEKPARVATIGDISKVTSLFTGKQMKETLGKASSATAVQSSPILSPTTPDAADFEKAFKCHKCEEVFPKFVDVRQHCITSHFSEYWQFYCEECDFRTWNHPLMRDHMKSVHNSSDLVKSDRKRQELLQAELKDMQNFVKTVLVPKKTGPSDDSKKTAARTGRMLSTKDLSMGDIKKRLQFRKQKSKLKDASKEHGQGSKSPIVINAVVLNAPLDRMHSIEKGASEDTDFVGTCFKCQQYRQGSLVEVCIPLIQITVVNEKECLFRCDCDYSSTKIPMIVFHLWSHTALNLYHCGLCMAEGNEKKEMATHCLTKHNQEVGLHSIRLFKSIVKLLEKRIEKVSVTLQEYHRKRPVISAPEDIKQTLDIKKALYKCSYCIYQRSSLLEVVQHEQDNHSVNLTKVSLDFRASMDNGLTERLHRGSIQKPTVAAPAAGPSGKKSKKEETVTSPGGENSNQSDKKGGKSTSEKHVMMKINLQKGKRKAVIMSESEGSNSSSEEKKPTPVTKKRRGSLPRESRSKECHVCDYKTDNDKDLEHHLLSKHTSIRPYECSKCKKGYLLKEDARNHIHRRHPNVSAKLVIIRHMEVIMNEARLQMMKYAREKQSGGVSSSQSGGPYKRIKVCASDSDFNKTLTELARQLKDPKFIMRPVVKLKDVTKTKRFRKYMKRKHKQSK
ncbi:uncharacterized protein LOC135491330 [Lineus longissimus]|uniref:uncharacterized protein LOC135491330 n=1 Tax=Lineus longissimus TaxID=88925 RepID=UPI00315C82D7